MREILFRGKSIDDGKWKYSMSLARHATENGIITSYHIGSGYDIVKADTVGQYTGLTDKNGKKIFEGDILRTGTRMGYVLFEKGCFRFRWKNFDKYRDDFFKTCIITEYGSFRELEVIANIHDNPELLKGGEG